jgi:hypothetical protein
MPLWSIVPSSIACIAARGALRQTGARACQSIVVRSAIHLHGWSAVAGWASCLCKERDTSDTRATTSAVARFYTTPAPGRERAHGVLARLDVMKEHHSHMVRRKADSKLVRRRLPGPMADRAWSRTRGAMSRGGRSEPSRDTAPPSSTHRGVAGDHQGAVFCQEGGVALALLTASAWCGRPVWTGGSRRCQD